MLRDSQVEILEDLKRSSIRWIASHGLGSPEAEDIFQQAILKAISSPTEAGEPERIASWFYRILKNTLIDEFRKTKSLAKTAEEYSKEILPGLGEEVETDLCRCVDGLLSELPPAERAILEKHFFEGKKFKALAAEFSQSEGAIRIKALRAREKLRDSLRRCCDVTRFAQVRDCDCAD